MKSDFLTYFCDILSTGFCFSGLREWGASLAPPWIGHFNNGWWNNLPCKSLFAGFICGIAELSNVIWVCNNSKPSKLVRQRIHNIAYHWHTAPQYNLITPSTGVKINTSWAEGHCATRGVSNQSDRRHFKYRILKKENKFLLLSSRKKLSPCLTCTRCFCRRQHS